MGRFLFGFIIGVAIGALAVIFSAPRSGSETIEGIRGLVDDAVAAGKQASVAHQQELWAQFRTGSKKKEV
jgi:gas vesicle protein